jgi:hypothetical protein
VKWVVDPGGAHGPTYLLANLGPKGGLVAGERKWKASTTKWWGTQKGLQAYWNGFGKFLTPAET